MTATLNQKKAEASLFCNEDFRIESSPEKNVGYLCRILLGTLVQSGARLIDFSRWNVKASLTVEGSTALQHKAHTAAFYTRVCHILPQCTVPSVKMVSD